MPVDGMSLDRSALLEIVGRRSNPIRAIASPIGHLKDTYDCVGHGQAANEAATASLGEAKPRLCRLGDPPVWRL